jgi:hypothetical protein
VAAHVTRSRADVAATGTFDVTVFPGVPPSISFDGDITFDPGVRSALGAFVDMATDVGDLTFEGDGTVNVANESAAFDLTAESAGDFDFSASGVASCENAGCLNGRGNFGGRLTEITDPAGVLPAGTFTFDGTIAIDAAGSGTGGRFAVNGFPRTATPAGTDVEISSDSTFWDTVADSQRPVFASARFATVTSPGVTEFVAFSTFPSEFPAGISVNRAVSVFVDVKTTAAVTGNVHVCLGYPDANHDEIVDGTLTNLPKSRLRLLYATGIDAPFTDVTQTVANQRICGDVPAVGPVAIGVSSGGSTSTTIVGESTTTSVTTSESSTTSTTLAPAATTTTTIETGGSTTSTTLPACTTAVDCLDVAIAGPLCPGETVNPKLSTLVLKKLTKAQTALLAARTMDSGRKLTRLVIKARKQMDKVGKKADAFASKRKGAISVACRDQIRAALILVTQQIAASRI